MKSKVIFSKLTLTGIRDLLEQKFVTKKSGKKFLLTDVQHYVRRGNIPNYLGGYRIVLDNSIKGVKLYNLLEKL